MSGRGAWGTGTKRKFQPFNHKAGSFGNQPSILRLSSLQKSRVWGALCRETRCTYFLLEVTVAPTEGLSLPFSVVAVLSLGSRVVEGSAHLFLLSARPPSLAHVGKVPRSYPENRTPWCPFQTAAFSEETCSKVSRGRWLGIGVLKLPAPA